MENIKKVKHFTDIILICIRIVATIYNQTLHSFNACQLGLSPNFVQCKQEILFTHICFQQPTTAHATPCPVKNRSGRNARVNSLKLT